MLGRIQGARPSPALMISLVALFVSLGGVGYAAATIGSSQITNNSVRGKDIRNSTITGKDVKNSGLTGSDVKNSGLTGSDVKNSSLTGSDVLESSLGKVPNAAHADDASTVGGQGPGAFFPAAKLKTIQRFTLTNNQTRVLITNGPLTLTAQCEINQTLETNANSDRAEVLVTTTVDGVALDANPEQDVVNANSPPDERDIFTTGIQTTGTEDVEASSNAGMVIAPGGEWVSSQGFFTAVNQTATGDGVCTFAGQLFVN
jgi:hypothetical protein